MIVYVVRARKHCEIDGVFADRKQAAYMCAIKNTGDMRIEEWDTEGVQFTGSRELLSRWGVTIGLDGAIKHLYEDFTFDEESSVHDDGAAGWLVMLTVSFGTEVERVKELALARLADWKEKHAKNDPC